MKAMILAAGFGKRLNPLTSKTPKALVKIKNKPALDWVIKAVNKLEPERIVVNAHHLGFKIQEHLEKTDAKLNITVILEDKILGTGAGIANAANILAYSTTLIHNVDIISDYDLSKLKKLSFGPKTLAYVLCYKKPSKSGLLLDKNGKLLSFFDDTKTKIQNPNHKYDANSSYGNIKKSFCGIHLVSKNFWEFITSLKKVPKSILDVYKLALKANFEILEHDIGNANIIDIGSFKNLNYANSSEFFLK